MELISELQTPAISVVVLTIVWILGGQMFSDMVASKRRQELRFFNKLYFTAVWPLLVFIVCIRT